MKSVHHLDETRKNLILALYDGTSKAIDELEHRLKVPRRTICHWAERLSCTRHREPLWSDEEVDYLESNLHKLSYEKLTEQFKLRFGTHRTKSAIKTKSKRLGVRKTGEGYTIMGLIQGLGAPNYQTVHRWINLGWLKGTRRESDRIESQHGDLWLFTPTAIRLFVRDHPGEIDPRRVDWHWLVDILVGSPQLPIPIPGEKKRLRDTPHPNEMKKKLTAEQVREIRRRYQAGTSIAQLAREYPVSGAAIYKIVTYGSWKYID